MRVGGRYSIAEVCCPWGRGVQGRRLPGRQARGKQVVSLPHRLVSCRAKPLILGAVFSCRERALRLSWTETNVLVCNLTEPSGAVSRRVSSQTVVILELSWGRPCFPVMARGHLLHLQVFGHSRNSVPAIGT